MRFEVEKKYWIDSRDEMIQHLESEGIRFSPPIEQIDKYFAHPARDFGQTDEALRLRSVGETNYITYKGARIDSTTKTRREFELPLLDGEYGDQFRELLVMLGFQPIMTIIKIRRKAEHQVGNYQFEISIDEIDQLGSFIELETTSDLEHLDLAKQALKGLAEQLKLDKPERRSYLELLTHQLGPNPYAGPSSI